MIKKGLFLLLPLLLTSCVQYKELVIFPSEKVVFAGTEPIENAVEVLLQPNDLLRITVHSFNSEAAAPFNIENINQQNGNMLMQGGGPGLASSNVLEMFSGYMVDNDGFINFPVLGKLQVKGLSLSQVETMVADGVKPYLKDAVVNVRMLNLKITVIGEVASPGIVRLSNQRITLLEAIANAGDFTPYANRTNVLLIREENGQRIYQRFDFQSSDLFKSPYFYLKQNDVLYIEPIRAKVATVADPLQRGISYGSAFLSFITLIIAVFR
jgi:polysaccharide export outer membrane protein